MGGYDELREEGDLRSPPFEFRRLVTGVLLIFGAAAGVLHGSRSSNVTLSNYEVILTTSRTTRAQTLQILLSNEYGGAPASLGAFYQWKSVIEPFRDTFLAIDGTSESRWTWSISYENDGQRYTSTTNGNATIVYNYQGPGGRPVEIVAISSSGATVREHVMAKYVRREIRSLTSEDANDFLDALAIMYTTRMDVGQAKYGTSFKSFAWFTRWHLGSNSEYSPYHGAPSFFTSHAAFGSLVDESLQSIHPRLCMHYWDFTIDQEILDDWSDSLFWSRNWFGPFTSNETSDTMKRVEGRFHDVTIPRNASANMSANLNVCRNSYGMLTEPYSNNPSQYLSRSASVCGLSTRGAALPGCTVLEGCITNTDMTSFHDDVEYNLHLPLHVSFGGAWECKEDLKNLAEQNPTLTKQLEAIGYDLMNYIHSLYYAGNFTCPEYCSLNTAFEDCLCRDEEVVAAIRDGASPEVYYRFFVSRIIRYMSAERTMKTWNVIEQNEGGKYVFKGMSDEENNALYEIYVKSISQGPKFGQFASPLGSANDPIFWPIHSNWEKHWQYMRLSNMTGNRAFDTSWAESMGEKGWGYNDTLQPFDEVYGIRRHPEGTYYTNRELTALFDPSLPSLPHMYDDFGYNHCNRSRPTRS